MHRSKQTTLYQLFKRTIYQDSGEISVHKGQGWKPLQVYHEKPSCDCDNQKTPFELEKCYQHSSLHPQMKNCNSVMKRGKNISALCRNTGKSGNVFWRSAFFRNTRFHPSSYQWNVPNPLFIGIGMIRGRISGHGMCEGIISAEEYIL